MATVSKSSLNVSAAVAATAATNGATIYTCPANSYAILNCYIVNTGTNSLCDVLVGGQIVASIQYTAPSFYSSVTNPSGGAPALLATSYQIVVGPGQAVTMTSTVGPGINTVRLSGVQFTNS